MGWIFAEALDDDDRVYEFPLIAVLIWKGYKDLESKGTLPLYAHRVRHPEKVAV